MAPQTKWDLSRLGKSNTDPEFAIERKRIKKLVNSFVRKWSNNKKYLHDPITLRKALDNYETICRLHGTAGKEGYYFNLKHSLNQLDSKVLGKQNQIQEFSKENQNNLLFFELSLGKIDLKIQGKLLTSPQLKDYKHYLEKIFKIAKYNLSDAEEKIMNLRTPTARSNWVKMLSTFLSKDEEEVLTDKGKRKITYTEIFPLFEGKNKKIRDSAASAVNTIFTRHVDTAEHELNSVLQDIKIVDSIRGIDRPDRMMHIHDNLDTQVVDTMVKAIGGQYKISKKYYSLKAKLLGFEKLEYHERQIAYGNTDKTYTYKQATKIVNTALVSLDQKFQDIFSGFLKNGQIDVYPKKGKRGGAFCSYNLITHPTYIFLNYTKKLDDVMTLAHEVGHGINNEMMREHQNSLNFSTPLATAEIASTFFQGFVFEKIMEESDEETRLALMVKSVGDDVGTIIRQIAADVFQRELHKAFRAKGYLSKEEIGSLFQKHMASYMGTSVKQSPGSENWWIYWSHIRVPFYNYQYAFGLLVAKYFLKLVKEDNGNIDKFKEFISAGASESPKQIFAKSGLDITDRNFWLDGIKETENLLKETEKLARRLGKI